MHSSSITNIGQGNSQTRIRLESKGGFPLRFAPLGPLLGTFSLKTKHHKLRPNLYRCFLDVVKDKTGILFRFGLVDECEYEDTVLHS